MLRTRMAQGRKLRSASSETDSRRASSRGPPHHRLFVAAELERVAGIGADVALLDTSPRAWVGADNAVQLRSSAREQCLERVPLSRIDGHNLYLPGSPVQRTMRRGASASIRLRPARLSASGSSDPQSCMPARQADGPALTQHRRARPPSVGAGINPITMKVALTPWPASAAATWSGILARRGAHALAPQSQASRRWSKGLNYRRGTGDGFNVRTGGTVAAQRLPPWRPLKPRCR